MLEQGRIAAHVVASWFADPPDDDRLLADQIPFLPRRRLHPAIGRRAALMVAGCVVRRNLGSNRGRRSP
jgi:hypothetical protein